MTDPSTLTQKQFEKKKKTAKSANAIGSYSSNNFIRSNINALFRRTRRGSIKYCYNNTFKMGPCLNGA